VAVTAAHSFVCLTFHYNLYINHACEISSGISKDEK
jgi:hypothetical protein